MISCRQGIDEIIPCIPPFGQAPPVQILSRRICADLQKFIWLVGRQSLGDVLSHASEGQLRQPSVISG